MAFYVGVVDRGGEGYGVWFPDLPGCTSGGKTMDDLFANGVAAIALWAADAIAEGEGIPRARSLDDLRNEPDVREAFALDGATFIQVPCLLEDTRTVRANISLEAGLLDAIDTAAKRAGMTRSSFLASAAKEKIKRA